MLKNQPTQPILNVYATDKCLSVTKVQTAIDDFIINAAAKSPDNYKYLDEVRFEPEMDLSMKSLGLAILFLQNALMAENTLKFLVFQPVPTIVSDGEVTPHQKYMILDSQAIEHLDLLAEKNSDGKPSYSLFDYIDHCKTPFGRRLLKKWMLSPLMDIDELI